MNTPYATIAVGLWAVTLFVVAAASEGWSMRRLDAPTMLFLLIALVIAICADCADNRWFW